MSFPAGHDSIDLNSASQRGCVLVVEADDALRKKLDNQLGALGFNTLLAGSCKEAITLYDQHSVDMVIMEYVTPGTPARNLIEHIKADKDDLYVPVLFMIAQAHESLLQECMAAGGDDYILKPFTPVILNIRLANLEQVRDLRNLYDNMLHEQTVARRILTAALSTRSAVVHDMQVMSKSADVFSGDLVLTARHPDGDLLVLLADFTGHGLTAAIGVLPVADVFSAMTEKGFNSQQILNNINQKLLTLLPTGMFMAACLVKINKDLKHASIWNGGMPEVFLLDNRLGKIKHRIPSSHLPLGISCSADRSFVMEKLEINAGDQFIMYSDGLTDATNSDGAMFGTSRLHLLIEDSASNQRVFTAIVNAFELFCDDEKPVDDVTLVNIPCNASAILPPRSLQDAIHE